MKKVFLTLLGILAFALLSIKIYLMVIPEIIVSNRSALSVKSVSIQLPNNKIVFGEIAPNSSNTIYYNIDQTDGTYKYHITFASGETISNECGNVTGNEIGKVFHITIKSVKEVNCSDSET